MVVVFRNLNPRGRIMVTFSNPRTRAEFTDWPLGGNKRGRCVFHVEYDAKRGYRVGRTTTGKPKYTTYGGPCCVVDGSDGRTYILRHAGVYGFVMVSRSDFMDAGGDVSGNANGGGSIFPDNPRWQEVNDLINASNAVGLAGGGSTGLILSSQT